VKRILSSFFVLSLLLLLIGCAQEGVPAVPVATTAAQEAPAAIGTTEASPVEEAVPEPETMSGRSLSIVSTIFPQYDWVRELLGARAGDMDLTFLISSTIDLHSFTPSVSDIATISDADLFIYVGGDSDDWVEAALRQARNQDMIVINLLDVLGDGVKLEEIIEGMQHDHDDCDSNDPDDCDDDSHNHGHSHGHSHSHDHEDEEDDHIDNDEGGHHHGETDEHVWLSLRNAVAFCYAIRDALTELDPDNTDLYAGNLEKYSDKLLGLDEEYATILDNLENRTLLFADRFPFRYLVDDYRLNYYAAFTGCSAETEASFSTIIFLAGRVDALGLDTVMITESGNRAIAETVISNTTAGNQQILELDSMQSVTRADIDNGVTYLSIMENNLQILKQALS